MSSIKKNSFTKCNCDICRKLKKIYIRGVGTVLLQLNYFKNIPTVILGKERYGQYEGEYNLFAGKMEKEDNGCYVQGAWREFTQESGIELSFNNYNKTIINRHGKYRYFVHGGTIIFVSKINSINRDTINNYIYKKNSNFNIPWAFREIEKIERFTLDGRNIHKDKKTNKIIYNKKCCKISSFASSIIPKIFNFI